MRIALVTGGASGLGQATAIRLAQDGLTIAVADLNLPEAQDVAERLNGYGHRGFDVDVSDEDSVVRLFADVERTMGPVAALLNFAGIYSTKTYSGRVSLFESDTHEWSRVMAVNATGTFYTVREMARRRQAVPVEHGRIVAAASVAGQMGGVQGGVGYSASKGAVLALVKSAARELAPQRITVNAIAPGAIDTPMMRRSIPAGQKEYGSLSAIPLARVGLPVEIAAAASYLISVEADFVTGATIDVNGGVLMR